MDVKEGGGELVEDECWTVEVEEGSLRNSSCINTQDRRWEGGRGVWD